MTSKFKIEQSEEYQGSDYWKWAVWLEASKQALNRVAYVEWTLHPTFRDPVRRKNNRSQKFRLETGGWGQFRVHARVQTKDGESFRLSHDLSLHYPDPKKTPVAQKGLEFDVPRGIDETLRKNVDDYSGTARRAARLSIGKGPVKKFSDLKALIESLPPEKLMRSHVPPITKAPNSARVQEEQINIRVKAFLYAAIKSQNNDFNLVVGRDPDAKTEMYLIMTVSGLPAVSSESFSQLSAVRDAFKDFFGSSLPNRGYDFYSPPIPIAVEGSLFFDISLATVPSPGPKSLRSFMPMKSWKVHPITRIVFPSS
jgi:pYEATS domain-containing protein involved in immunity